jgi:hypothetical protein
MVKLKGNKEIGEKIDKIIGKLAEANDLKGVIDVAEFNDEDKLGKAQDIVDRLSKLVGIFESLDFSANRAEGDDLLGDAYEYLMRHFATESGKSKDQRIGRIVPTADFDLTFGSYFLLEPLNEIENTTSSTTVKRLSHSSVEGIKRESE